MSSVCVKPLNPESALEIYCSTNPLGYQALSRFLFLMYEYTPSNNPESRDGDIGIHRSNYYFVPSCRFENLAAP